MVHMRKYGDITDVGVVAYIDKEGTIKPLFIVWEDIETGNSEKFKFDKIVDFRELIPGHFMWNVLVRNRNVNLHYSDGKWYTVKGI